MITLSNSTTSLEVMFPTQWDVSALSGLTLQIADTAGVELLAASAVSLYTPSVLAAEASQFETFLTLDAGASALAVGDLIAIEGVNGFEVHTVKGWDAANTTVSLEEILDRSFEAGADVYRMSGTISVDLSDTDVYPPGTQVVLNWTPTGTGAPFSERAEVEASIQIDVAAFTNDFKSLYSRAYSALSKPADRFETILRIAQDQLRLQLYARGLDVARLKDQRLLSPPLMALVAKLWTLNGDNDPKQDMINERKKISAEYESAFNLLCSLPVWVDSDGDGVLDDAEVSNHPTYFERAW